MSSTNDPSRRATSNLRRRTRRILWGTASGVALLIAAGLPVYVFPPVDADSTRRADLAYVIGPPTEERVAMAQRLRDAGIVDAILISVRSNGSQSVSELSACAQPNVTCAVPDPLTTAGEAALLNDYARHHPTERVTVITFAPHVARTRFIFDICSSADIAVASAPTRLNPVQWAYQYAYQSTAFVKAAIAPCTGGGAAPR